MTSWTSCCGWRTPRAPGTARWTTSENCRAGSYPSREMRTSRPRGSARADPADVGRQTPQRQSGPSPNEVACLSQQGTGPVNNQRFVCLCALCVVCRRFACLIGRDSVSTGHHGHYFTTLLETTLEQMDVRAKGPGRAPRRDLHPSWTQDRAFARSPSHAPPPSMRW